ncbi:ATP-grasp domain-containing protein [Patescibacteria group bacterium]|nr:ATP-grasp domain-containing protein [Patescibacteria group bacterium]
MKKVLILATRKNYPSIPLAIKTRLKKLKVDCDYQELGDVKIILENNKSIMVSINGCSLSDYGFVFIRTIGKLSVSREVATIISRECERLGIPYMDKVHRDYITDNKLISGYMMNSSGVSIPKTVYLGNKASKDLGELKKILGFPLIIKKTDSEKAKDVFLIKDYPELEDFVKNNGMKEFIFQELIKSSKDCRLYIIDKEVGFTVLRKSDAIIKNVNVGATREYIEASEPMNQVAIAASKATHLTLSGVDVLESEDGSLYVLEVNRAPAYSEENGPGSRFDFVADYIKENL